MSAFEKARKLAFYRYEVEAGNVSWLELYKDVDVTIGPKIIAKYRAEQGQPPYVMPSAECR